MYIVLLVIKFSVVRMFSSVSILCGNVKCGFLLDEFVMVCSIIVFVVMIVSNEVSVMLSK